MSCSGSAKVATSYEPKPPSMVINDRHRLVFIHVPKSGGASVGAALSQLDGNRTRWLAGGSKHETLAEFRQRWRHLRGLSDWVLRRSATGYRTLGFVCNPWQRMSSLYRYMKEKRPRAEIDGTVSLDGFLQQAV